MYLSILTSANDFTNYAIYGNFKDRAAPAFAPGLCAGFQKNIRAVPAQTIWFQFYVSRAVTRNSSSNASQSICWLRFYRARILNSHARPQSVRQAPAGMILPNRIRLVDSTPHRMSPYNNFSSVEDALLQTLTDSQTTANFDFNFNFNLKGRVNFKRVGWAIFIALTFFNSQFGWLQFNKPDNVEPYWQNAPRVIKPAPDGAERPRVRQSKKLKTRKKRCL